MTRVVELRQYTLRPGQRDTLITLFDRELVHPQEAVGMRIFGQFRDLDAPDRFVWVRGFPDMASRAASLAAFYGGPVWREHSSAANATMIDSDDVLLLRPVHGEFTVPGTRDLPPSTLVVASVYHPDQTAGFAAQLADVVALLDKAGATLLGGVLQTEPAENTFPALPVRAGEEVLVWFASFPSEDAIDEWIGLEPALPARVTRLRLAPTARSLLR